MSLGSLIAEARRLHPDLAKKWDEQEKREREYAEIVRVAGARAVERIASAMQSPRVARADLEEARTHLERAISAAAALDPE